MAQADSGEDPTPTAWTLVTEYFKCSAVRGRKWAIIPCPKVATMHVTDAYDAPFCAEHGMKVVKRLARGEKVMTGVV